MKTKFRGLKYDMYANGSVYDKKHELIYTIPNQKAIDMILDGALSKTGFDDLVIGRDSAVNKLIITEIQKNLPECRHTYIYCGRTSEYNGRQLLFACEHCLEIKIVK